MRIFFFFFKYHWKVLEIFKHWIAKIILLNIYNKVFTVKLILKPSNNQTDEISENFSRNFTENIIAISVSYSYLNILFETIQQQENKEHQFGTKFLEHFTVYSQISLG